MMAARGCRFLRELSPHCRSHCLVVFRSRGRRRQRRGNGGGCHAGGHERGGDGPTDRADEESRDVEVAQLKYLERDAHFIGQGRCPRCACPMKWASALVWSPDVDHGILSVPVVDAHGKRDGIWCGWGWKR